MTADTSMGLRERKRLRTRAAIIAAAARLFAERGYEATTLTDIAAAADIAPRTFFSYFPTKESVLFPESEDRVRAAVSAIVDRAPDVGPVDALLHALDVSLAESDDMTGNLAEVRIRLVREEPVVGAVGAQFQYKAVREIARALLEEFSFLTAIQAGALAGAFVGAAGGAVSAALELGGADAGDAPSAADIRAAVADALTDQVGCRELR